VRLSNYPITVISYPAALSSVHEAMEIDTKALYSKEWINLYLFYLSLSHTFLSNVYLSSTFYLSLSQSC
jgi:predicted N-acyltransferase